MRVAAKYNRKLRKSRIPVRLDINVFHNQTRYTMQGKARFLVQP